MRYISALELSNQELQKTNYDYLERMQEFRCHLYSDKFKEDNSISVSDVLRWIDYIKWGN